MGLLDKLEQVEIKADSRLPEDDLMFCETQQQAYDESCRALREIRQQWKKAIQAQRDLLGIGQDGSLPYFGSNYRFGITDLNRELEKFHSRFISELTQHFNEKYSVTISTDAIKEHLIPAEPDPYRCDMDTSKEYHRNLRALSLHYEDVVDQMFIQLDGLGFVERAFQELRTKSYCTLPKRARHLKSRDLNRRAPEWFPKRKVPNTLRIYYYRSPETYMLDNVLHQGFAFTPQPKASRYAMAYEGTSTLSPREFWLKLLTQKDTELLGIEVKAKSVVEIDDGLAPCFFFKTEEGYTRCQCFDADRARTNCMEGWEGYNQEDIK